MKNSNHPAWAVIFLLYSCAATGYQPSSHEQMTDAAYENSVLNGATFQSRFGVSGNQTFAPRDPSTLAVYPSQTPRIAVELMKYGARAEDEKTRPLNHFLDPQNLNRSILPPNLNSADWALQESGRPYAEQQKMDYQDALSYYRAGLTATSKADRVKNLGLMFQALGHIVHHLQDMAQPQHVRNDDHCDSGLCETFEAVTGIDVHQPSDYEGYAATGLTLDYIRSLYTNSDYSTGVSFLGKGFVSPRDYWLKASGGMATFVSRNFVSEDTNFRDADIAGSLANVIDITATTHPEFPQPTAGNMVIGRDVSAADLCDGGAKCNLNGVTYFLSKQITDPVTGRTHTLEKFSSVGLFDDKLAAHGFSAMFALNRFNYEDRYPTLIPRAVAFSAALIDHFFRGEINVAANPSADSLRFSLRRSTGQVDTTSFVGTVTLYYDRADNSRLPVPGASWSVNWTPGQALMTKSFTYPADANGTFMLVFNGRIDGQSAVFGRSVTMSEQAQCGVPLEPPKGGQGLYTYQYAMGADQGIEVLFEAFAIPDRLKITGNGVVLMDTVGRVSGYNVYDLAYDPSVHDKSLNVTVDAPLDGTAWRLCVSCQSSGTTCTLQSDRRTVQWSFYDGGAWWACDQLTAYFDGRQQSGDVGNVVLTPGEHQFGYGGACYCTVSSTAACADEPAVWIDGTRHSLGSFRFTVN